MITRITLELFLLILAIVIAACTGWFVIMIKRYHSTKEDQDTILIICCIVAAVTLAILFGNFRIFGIPKEVWISVFGENPTSELLLYVKQFSEKVRAGLKTALQNHTQVSDLLLLTSGYLGYLIFVPVIHQEMTEEVHSEINLVTIFWIIGIGAVLFLL